MLEYDSPAALLADPASEFSALVRESHTAAAGTGVVVPAPTQSDAVAYESAQEL